MRMFYIAFSTPNGPGATFFKSPKHPLERHAYNNLITTVSRAMSMRNQVLVQPDQVILLNIVELEPEAITSFEVIDAQEAPGSPAAEDVKQAEPGVDATGEGV